MFDVIIIGAGATGLFSGLLLAQSGKKTLILEAKQRAGNKLALCGGGSCNLGPREKDKDDLWRRYETYSPHKKTGLFRRESARFLKALYYTFPPELVRTVWESAGPVNNCFQGLNIQLREENGLLFPSGMGARELADELEKRARTFGAEFRFNAIVTGLMKDGKNGYSVRLQDGSLVSAPAVILATGGFSYPAVGGNDSGNGLLAGIGIQTQTGKPAMGPVHIQDYPFTQSSGTVIPARVSVISGTTGSCIVQGQTDSLLFTHRGFSGPAILDICAAVHECAKESPTLLVDFLPSHSVENLLSHMQQQVSSHPKKQSASLITDFYPKFLAETMLKSAGIDIQKTAAEITKAQMRTVAENIKKTMFIPLLPSPLSQSMGWTGGCDPKELDFSTMECIQAPGLFVTGDMVSMCRPCGGYSLWFCWTSALAAAIKISYT